MPSLKEALLKAGLITQQKIKASEQASKKRNPPIHRPNKVAKGLRSPKPPPKEKVHEHHIRTSCDHCGKTSPDVEYYQHRNKGLNKYWLCVRCADDYSVSDEFRQTRQSPHAQTGLFRREYGATKPF